jgi:hypothetical protein
VAEHVVPLLLDHHPVGVDHRLAVPDLPADPDLPLVEDHVHLAVVHDRDERPDEEQRDGDHHVPGPVHPHVQPAEVRQDVVPPPEQGEQQHHGDDPDDDEEGHQPAERDGADQDDDEQDGGEDHAQVVPPADPQLRLVRGVPAGRR